MYFRRLYKKYINYKQSINRMK